MGLRDKLEIAVYVVTLLGALAGALRLIRWWRNRRNERQEDDVLVDLRLRSRDSPTTLVLGADPGSRTYYLYERMATKGKLSRSVMGTYWRTHMTSDDATRIGVGDPAASLALADETIETLRRLLPGASELIDQIKHMASDPSAMITAPRSWQARVEDTVAAHADAVVRGGVGSEALPAMAALLAKLRADQARADGPLVAYPPGSDFLAYLRQARAQLPEHEFRAVIEPRAAAPRLADLVLPGTGALLGGGMAFEPLVAAMARHLQHVAEVWYKPLLQDALRLTRLLRGQSTVPIPDHLGQVVGECRDCWAPLRGPVVVLRQDVVIARNSEAHRKTMIDPRGETITFMDRPPRGPARVFGPLSREDVGRFTQGFLRLCLAMWTAYRVALAEDGEFRRETA